MIMALCISGPVAVTVFTTWLGSRSQSTIRSRLAPQCQGTGYRQTEQDKPAPEHHEMKLGTKHQMQHVRFQEIQCQADGPKRRRKGDEAELIYVVWTVRFAVIVAHGNLPPRCHSALN